MTPRHARLPKGGQDLRRRQLLFLVYDDPEAPHPGRNGRVFGARRLGRLDQDFKSVLRVESLDAMPQLWVIDDVLLTVDRLPPRGICARIEPKRASRTWT